MSQMDMFCTKLVVKYGPFQDFIIYGEETQLALNQWPTTGSPETCLLWKGSSDLNCGQTAGVGMAVAMSFPGL